MLNQIPHSRRLAIFLSGIWLFVSGLFSLMIGAEEFFVEYDPTAAFLTTWLFVGVMPLGLVWGAAWVVGGYRLERRQVAMREPEPGEGLRPQGIGSLEGGGTVTRLRVLLAQHPAWTLVGGVVVVVAVAIGLIPPGTSPIEYKTGFGEAFVYALTSPCVCRCHWDTSFRSCLCRPMAAILGWLSGYVAGPTLDRGCFDAWVDHYCRCRLGDGWHGSYSPTCFSWCGVGVRPVPETKRR